MDFEQVYPDEFKLGDRVRPVDASGLYMTSTVKAISEKYILLFRPYVITNEHAYGHKFLPDTKWEEQGKMATCYLGVEEYTIQRDDKRSKWYIERHYKVID